MCQANEYEPQVANVLQSILSSCIFLTTRKLVSVAHQDWPFVTMLSDVWLQAPYIVGDTMMSCKTVANIFQMPEPSLFPESNQQDTLIHPARFILSLLAKVWHILWLVLHLVQHILHIQVVIVWVGSSRWMPGSPQQRLQSQVTAYMREISRIPRKLPFCCSTIHSHWICLPRSFFFWFSLVPCVAFMRRFRLRLVIAFSHFIFSISCKM